MGFGGSTLAMITSLKNNNRRRKKKPFENIKAYIGYGNNVFNKKHPNYKKATEEQLKVIREKVQKENRKLLIKRICLVIIIPTLVILTFIILSKY